MRKPTIFYYKGLNIIILMSRNKLQRTTLLNIDSSTRNMNPKNIYLSNNKTLPIDPLQFTMDSNIVQVNYMNHGFSIGDMIIVQNVTGISRTLMGSFYLLNNFGYITILFPNNMISTNYTKTLYVNVDIYGTQIVPNIISNILLNSFIGYQEVNIYDDINISENMSNNLKSMVAAAAKVPLSTVTTDYMNNNVLFIELPIIYIDHNNNYLQIDQTFTISYLHIAGVPLPNINANYPISNYNYQSCQQVTNVIDSNNFQFQLNVLPFSTINGGGSNVQMMKITNTIEGYPNASNYTIDLKKSFTNVINIEMVSSEFPYVDMTIKKGINDKLYWNVYEDGPYVYSVQIDEGNYNSTTLVSKLTSKLNTTERTISTALDIIYNNFTVTFDPKINSISFTNYVNKKLPNSLSITIIIIDNLSYLLLTINDPGNYIMKNDQITISNASAVTLSIDNDTTIYSIGAEYINDTFKINSSDSYNDSYTVILGLQNEIYMTEVKTVLNGGYNINVTKPIAISLLFNYNDTIGDIIGFNDVGSPYSITNFLSTVTNTSPYVNNINIDSIGNINTYSNGFVNLTGNYNYILMYMNNIEYIYNTNNLQSAFAKIQLSGNPGDILFNTFIKQTDAYANIFPILSLNQLNISYSYPDGKPVEFRNINHSFTLKIVEEITQYDMIYLKSKDTSVEEQMLKAKLED
jgi:hypothetical protein